MFGDASGVNIGTIYALLSVSGYEDAVQKLKEFESQSKKTSQESSGAMSVMSSAISRYLMQIGAAIVSTQQLMAGLRDVMEEDTAYTRLQIATERLGFAWSDVKEKLRGFLQEAQMFSGISESRLIPPMTRLLAITRDFTTTQNLVNLAVRAAVIDGADYEQVMNIFARAMAGATIRGGELARVLGLNVRELRTGEQTTIDFSRAIEILTQRYSDEKGLTLALSTSQAELKRWSTTLGEIRETVIQPFLEGLLWIIRVLEKIGRTAVVISLMVEDSFKYTLKIVKEVLDTVDFSKMWSINPVKIYQNIRNAFQTTIDAMQFYWEAEFAPKFEQWSKRLKEIWADWGTEIPTLPPVGEIKAPVPEPEETQQKAEKVKQTVEDMNKSIQQSYDETNKYAERVSDTLARAFANMVVDGKISFSQLLVAFKNMLAEMIAEILRARISQWISMYILPFLPSPGWGKGIQGDFPPGGMNVAGFNPPSPPSGTAGISVIFANNTRGSLATIFENGTIAEQKQFAFQIYRIGQTAGQEMV